MCSICGEISYDMPPRQSVIRLSSDTMRHRGPDQHGLRLSGAAALAHNRLSVMDPAGGIQPMSADWQGKTYTIVYNGEVYNVDELKPMLSAKGAVFTTSCDTEVVLWAYILLGEDCPQHLNGIFAFAVWDGERLFLARDRFGVKPLFYSLVGDTLLFASEIKALLAHPDVSPVVDADGLWQLLFLSPVTVPGSGIFRDIREVLPAHAGYFSRDGLRLHPYWSLKATTCSDSYEEAADHVRALLTDAVVRQLGSDVPLCTFLSGGLDSSAVTAIAAKNTDALSTYSFEYEGNKQHFHRTLFQPQGDDMYAIRAARALGTSHTVLTVPTDEVAACLSDAVTARDFPGQADIDSSLLWFCRQVKNRHTVALCGECADEIFGGYPWFYRPEMLYREFFPWVHDPFVRANLFRPEWARPKDGYDALCDIYRQTLEACPLVDGEPDEDRTARVATWLSVNYFMASLLERKDRMSMASGVEVRVPYADHRILEYVFNVPWHIKFAGNTEKALLRQAMDGLLPDDILWRKKSPYPKTHNPAYEKLVTDLLKERLSRSDSALAALLAPEALAQLLESRGGTWFGQLMGKPQLLAWLLQFEEWVEKYNVQFAI
ncbi:MAG: asparagine synthase (glutamine-hydrolyzing) [Clostridia bacterium]|nr:asparagine synthase (glutamine-hydrolyzing) [Clostridia bacterium]